MTQKVATLEVQPRSETGRAARRVAGTRIPAVIYGHGTSATPIWVEMAAFARVFSEVGESGMFTVVFEGKNIPSIVRDVQYDALSHAVSHVDFYHVSKTEEVVADVPVVLYGTSEAVKRGGTLVHGVDTLTVRALPQDLPQEIRVDITPLNDYEDTIMVGDISVPDGVSFVTEETVVVASVSRPRVAEEDESGAEESTDTAEESSDIDN